MCVTHVDACLSRNQTSMNGRWLSRSTTASAVANTIRKSRHVQTRVPAKSTTRPRPGRATARWCATLYCVVSTGMKPMTRRYRMTPKSKEAAAAIQRDVLAVSRRLRVMSTAAAASPVPTPRAAM